MVAKFFGCRDASSRLVCGVPSRRIWRSDIPRGEAELPKAGAMRGAPRPDNRIVCSLRSTLFKSILVKLNAEPLKRLEAA